MTLLLHTADWQIGRTYARFAPDDALALAEARIATVERLARRAAERGADAVLVAGCHPGDCHYAEGNFYARRRMLMLNQLLQFAGVPSERFWFRWVSAAEGPEFAHLIEEITETVRPLGPYKPELADKFVLLDEIVQMLESMPESEPCPEHAEESEEASP